jgi:hypothetical protein
MGIIWLLEAVLLGWLLALAFFPLAPASSRLARLLLGGGAGAILGVGLASCIFFLVGVLLGSSVAAMVVELVLLSGAGYLALRRRGTPQPSKLPSWSVLVWIAALGLILAAGIATAGIAAGFAANPHGEWDAWGIWNLRAKFLASGPELAPRAWSPLLSSVTQTKYPLLTSEFVARCWALGHSISPDVPAALSYLFFLSLLAIITGGVAALRGPPLGLLAGLVLATTPTLLHQVPVQFADVPLACYFAGAVVLALLECPVPAGILAGFSVWTKDEGWLFLLLFLGATAIFQRRAVFRTMAGALPVVLVAAFFKLWMARGGTSLLAASIPGIGHRLADGSRYATVLSAFAHGAVTMGPGWYHPILPIAVLGLALGLDRSGRRHAAYTAAIAGLLLFGYFWVYIITGNDLRWQLDTSLNRLLVQVWPILVVGAFLSFRVPQPQPAPVAAPSQLPKKRRKRTR